jgi:hypothetical protein
MRKYLKGRNSMPLKGLGYGVLLLASAVVLSGCSESRFGDILSFEKSAPDEFAVVKRAPLSLPPDFGLRPPRPGASRPQDVSARSAARDSLIGNSTAGKTRQARKASKVARLGDRSAGEAALLNRTGALDVDPSIRQLINREASGAVEIADEDFIDKLLFWRDEKTKKVQNDDALIIDATKEARRLRENEVLGKPLTAGKTPTIQRKKSGSFF